MSYHPQDQQSNQPPKNQFQNYPPTQNQNSQSTQPASQTNASQWQQQGQNYQGSTAQNYQGQSQNYQGQQGQYGNQPTQSSGLQSSVQPQQGQNYQGQSSQNYQGQSNSTYQGQQNQQGNNWQTNQGQTSQNFQGQQTSQQNQSPQKTQQVQPAQQSPNKSQSQPNNQQFQQPTQNIQGQQGQQNQGYQNQLQQSNQPQFGQQNQFNQGSSQLNQGSSQFNQGASQLNQGNQSSWQQQQSPQGKKNQPLAPQNQKGQKGQQLQGNNNIQPIQGQNQPIQGQNQPIQGQNQPIQGQNQPNQPQQGNQPIDNLKQNTQKQPEGQNLETPETQAQQQEALKNLTGPQIVAFMKKKPYSQKIGTIDYTYSILSKKKQTFMGANNRFLILKGLQSIAYAREFLEKTTPLPFTEETQIPKTKATFLITQIQKVTNEQDKLTINFTPGADKKAIKWQFACPSKDCCLKWKKKIETAKKTLDQFKNSGYSNLDDFVRFQEFNSLQQHSQQQGLVNIGLLQTQSPNNTQFQGLNTNNSQFNSNSPNKSQLTSSQGPNQFGPNQSSSQFNSNQPHFDATKQNNPQSSQFNQPNKGQSNSFLHNDQNNQGSKINNSNFSNNNFSNNNFQQQQNFNQGSSFQNNVNNSNKPTSVYFQGPQASKIDNFITNRAPQHHSYLDQSMSRIPHEEKQGIKHEIRRLRRNWIEQLLGGQQEVELLIDFRNYAQRIAEVIVNELYVSQDVKIYPASQSTKDYASYSVDDINIEIYFLAEDNLSSKHPRYKNAVQQFKNFEYLINATKNQGILKVPFMTLFEYKGFLGMAKSKLGQNQPFKNREFYDLINRKEFQEITRISPQVLLNEKKCKIVSYDRQNNGTKFITQFNKVYFTEKLAQFLPLENSKQFGPNQDKVLRAQFVCDDQFEDQIFRDRVRLVRSEKVNGLMQKKIDQFVRVLQNEENYFTNSQELSELLHLYGINVHYLGVIFKKTRLTWLKRIFQAEIAARCLKNYFRLDLQNSVLQSFDQTNRKERQEERQRNKVVSFLNVVFGNTDPTFRLWKNLNSSAIQKYHIKIWDNEFTDINSGYLLQAIQTHLKILLTYQASQRRFFQSTNSFDPRDFVRFNFDSNTYDLEFTTLFEEINEFLQEQSLESFQGLCQILTKETSTKVSYLDLLKNHPIHDKISQFLLNFTSPQDNFDLYNKIQSNYLPHKFLYESKFAEIKWYLKANKQQLINKSASFIQDHVRKWFGEAHPLFIQLYRLLAEYFSEMQFHYSKALQYATDSLKIHRVLFEGDSEPIWRDYYLIGKIHFINNRSEESLNYLNKAKALVKAEKLTEYESYGDLCIILAKVYFAGKYYKQSYSTVRELYKIIREERDQRSLIHIVEAVTLIKQLLQINQEHESYYKFVESDFSNIVYAFADHPNLMIQSIKMITIPYLKNVILRNSKNKVRLLSIIEEISKIKQSQYSCQTYIKAKISEGTFPKSYLHCLKEIDSVIDEILANQMIERWKSFNNLANQSILDKIGNSPINRGFDFLANMTALFNLLGQEVLEELFIMEK